MCYAAINNKKFYVKFKININNNSNKHICPQPPRDLALRRVGLWRRLGEDWSGGKNKPRNSPEAGVRAEGLGLAVILRQFPGKS